MITGFWHIHSHIIYIHIIITYIHRFLLELLSWVVHASLSEAKSQIARQIWQWVRRVTSCTWMSMTSAVLKFSLNLVNDWTGQSSTPSRSNLGPSIIPLLYIYTVYTYIIYIIPQTIYPVATLTHDTAKEGTFQRRQRRIWRMGLCSEWRKHLQCHFEDAAERTGMMGSTLPPNQESVGLNSNL